VGSNGISEMTQILKEVDQQLKDLLQKSYSIALFVGAGTSVESGIGTFRGEGQMSYFEGVPPAYLCTVKALEKSPQLCWKFFNHLYSILQKSKPSSSHQFNSSGST
jgi:NAD-dependent SIR2 family protein deacetylase